MIRTATHADVDAMVELGAAMHRESNYAPLHFNRQRTANFVHWLIDNPDCFVVVGERDNEVMAYLLAMASPAWFGDGIQKIASDLGLYVRPENRRGATAIQLVQAYRQWGLKRGYAQIRAGTSAGQQGQSANAIYEHFGFQRAGHCFVLDNVPAHVGQTFDHHLAVH